MGSRCLHGNQVSRDCREKLTRHQQLRSVVARRALSQQRVIDSAKLAATREEYWSMPYMIAVYCLPIACNCLALCVCVCVWTSDCVQRCSHRYLVASLKNLQDKNIWSIQSFLRIWGPWRPEHHRIQALGKSPEQCKGVGFHYAVKTARGSCETIAYGCTEGCASWE